MEDEHVFTGICAVNRKILSKKYPEVGAGIITLHNVLN